MLKLFMYSIIINVLYNYFNGSTKLFLDLYLDKFLDASAKPFFLCTLTHIFKADDSI